MNVLSWRTVSALITYIIITYIILCIILVLNIGPYIRFFGIGYMSYKTVGKYDVLKDSG